MSLQVITGTGTLSHVRKLNHIYNAVSPETPFLNVIYSKQLLPDNINVLLCYITTRFLLYNVTSLWLLMPAGTVILGNLKRDGNITWITKKKSAWKKTVLPARAEETQSPSGSSGTVLHSDHWIHLDIFHNCLFWGSGHGKTSAHHLLFKNLMYSSLASSVKSTCPD